MKKIKWLIPVLSASAIVPTIAAVTSCSNKTASIEYTGRIKNLEAKISSGSERAGSQILYFKINNAKKRSPQDKIVFSVLNNSSLSTIISFDQPDWTSYANGEFSVVIKWTSTEFETAYFDLRVQYTNDEDISSCVDTRINGFSATLMSA